MASTTLYPPNVPSYIPAFTNDTLYLTFTLSDINMDTSQVQGIHVSIIKQSTGKSVVNKNYNQGGNSGGGSSGGEPGHPKRISGKALNNSNSGVYGGSGILIINTSLDALPHYSYQGTTNYRLPIQRNFVTTGDDIGWGIGWIYKIQIRFSSVAYDGSIGQTAWLNLNANNFSEWSTFCITKTIGYPEWTCPLEDDGDIFLYGSTLNFIADYQNQDVSEILYSYNLTLTKYIYSHKHNESTEEDYDFDSTEEIIEKTNEIYTNQYYNPNQVQYNFKSKLQSTEETDEIIEPGIHLITEIEYELYMDYTTLNKYNNSYYYDIKVEYSEDAQTPVQVITADNVDAVSDQSFKDDFNSHTFIAQEEEEGRIGLKLYLNDDTPCYDTFIITRADSKDNFQTWTDIKWVFCYETVINELPMIYDYTIESGIWYKYSVQTYRYDDEHDVYVRGVMNTMAMPIIREFEFAYLIGEGGRQLKLKFNNIMNNYVYNFSDGKQDPIGGQYPFISRNGNLKYRTIPINGLISFNMDEQELFITDLELYEYPEVVELYQNRHKKYYDYDYIKERDFREAVLAFLQDGKPKLFKSTTEGNIIVRLMGVSAQPNQTLNRMIYSFTATGHETADATMENYLKYKFYSTGEEEGEDKK